MRQILILLAIVLFCPSFTYAQEKTGAEQRRIREIRVFIETIYTEEQAEKSSWADFANRFHTPTRESVIKTDLLFKEGDVLDEELLKQSERRLRRFQFLNKAEVKVVPVDNKTVDVEVYTKDAWSLVPGMNIKGGGDLYTISAHLMEVNLLGYGKKLYAEGIYESDVGTTWKFGYSDYQLFNSRWIGNAVYQTGPLIESAFLQARLPLYSIDSVWSYGGSVYSADQIIRHFENGDESSRFAKDQVRLEAYMTRSFGERYKKTNLKFSLKYLEADYSTLGAQTTVPPPPDQINITPTVRLSTENIKWDKFTYIDKMGPVEDNWLGIRYGGKVGYGFPLEGGFELWDVGANAHKNTTFANDKLLLLDALFDTEVVRNSVLFGSARYYKKFTGHTVATRFKLQASKDLDSSRQFTLGADSGLRGYPARYFSGEELLLINLEDRQFWGEHNIGPKLAIGTVLFVDGGNAWKEAENIDVVDMNWSAGGGIRIGFSNLPHQPIFRMDFGWSIGDFDSFAVTVGMEQQF